MTKMKFLSRPSNLCLYKRERNGTVNFIAVYIDDMVNVCDSEAEFEKVMFVMKKQFKLSSLGNRTFFLGMKVDGIDD